MKVELRKMRAKSPAERSKANYIARLQQNGKLPKHISELGYVCYDTEEYKAYKKSVKWGRPAKC